MTKNISPLTVKLPKQPGRCLYWGNLHGASLSLAIATAAKEHNGPIVVLCADSLHASQIEYDIRFFIHAHPELPLLNFPDWETLPYDNFSPHQDIISQRLASLSTLGDLKQGLLILPTTTLATRLAPKTYIYAHTFILKCGDNINLDHLRQRFEQSGYRAVSQVMEHGEFAVRGSLFDIFPMGNPHPYRIDLLDDEIDSIRVFDPESQRSAEEVSYIRLLPAHEFPLNDKSLSLFRKQWRSHFSGDPLRAPLYRAINELSLAPGIEYYLPLFFEQTQSLFDYLPENSLIINIGSLEAPLKQFWNEINQRYSQYQHDIERPILAPKTVYLPTDEIFGKINQFLHIEIRNADQDNKTHIDFPTNPPPDLFIEAKHEQPLAKVNTFVHEQAERTLFCAESPGRAQALLELLATINIKPTHFEDWQAFLCSTDKIGITIAPFDAGLWLSDSHIALVAESQLFGQQIMQRRRRKKRFEQSADAIIKNLTELNVGSPVVHLNHGVGRYLGLHVLSVNQCDTEFLLLEYADDNKLYVPVSSLHLISRYSGSDLEHAPLHHLGSPQWQKAKRKAFEKVRDVAAQLLNVYARRSARQGHAFPKPDEQYTTFAASFPFEETPDQQQAIEQVIQDMLSPEPMDRLVCGDVGFGKTEVAMRATFISVYNHKQVAILVPTTLLAQQHYDNFKDRFANWPVTIEILSRFRTLKEQEAVIEKVNQGQVDIVIGTHKLLTPKLKFKDLGLLVIDEEHRFGVRHKERLKAMRAEVDILTLTATPIPRTLNMAISGMRELSIIATPPQQRLSIKTFVREYNPTVIREAIIREIMRGGQIYVVHNDIATIEATARSIEELVPEASVRIGHGQMRERDLEQVMIDYYHHRFNVLVCTTIIETGIDVPSANTIIINRADKFGLAQLHQLRGRVGRSHHQAYAYLFTPHQKSLTRDAIKRLDAVASLEVLGAGFTLATHDLEIRGAGEILGEGQSGNIQSIGFQLYMELLDNAVKAIKSGKEPDINMIEGNSGTEVDFSCPALIPETYIPDVHTRLTLYKRIASCTDETQLDELRVEIIDRFGIIPVQLLNLMRISRLKLHAATLGITKIDANPKGGRLEFTESPNIDPSFLINLIQKQPQQFKLEGNKRLRFNLPLPDHDKRIDFVKQLLKLLSGKQDSKIKHAS